MLDNLIWSRYHHDLTCRNTLHNAILIRRHSDENVLEHYCLYTVTESVPPFLSLSVIFITYSNPSRNQHVFNFLFVSFNRLGVSM